MRLLLFLCLALCLAAACKRDFDAPCRAVNVDTVRFTYNESTLFPYAAGDTFRYVNELADTINCIVRDYRPFTTNVAYHNNPECPDDSIGYAAVFTDVVDSPGHFRFAVTMYKQANTFSITSGSSQFQVSLSSLANDSINYVDSLQLGGTWFHDVQRFTGSNSGDSIYYNRLSGLLRIKNGAGAWTLTK